MLTPTERFITRMKLRELRTQRDQLRVTYDTLSQQAEAAASDAERVRLLYAHLHTLTLAQQPLHPTVANLEPLLRDNAPDCTVSEVMDFWQRRLQQELEQGRLRSDIVYVFGTLLNDWATAPPAPPPGDQQSGTLRADLLTRITQTPESHTVTELLDSSFTAAGITQANMARHLYSEDNVSLRAGVEPHEIRPLLQYLVQDRHRSAALRHDARRFLENNVLLKELTDALTMLVSSLDNWDWPTAGITAHAQWSHTRWRLFVDNDLPTACLLEVIGSRWQMTFQEVLRDVTTNPNRLNRLLALNAPEAIIQHERRRLQHEQRRLHQAAGWDTTTRVDIWDDQSPVAAERYGDDSELAAQMSLRGEPDSVMEQRMHLQNELRTLRHLHDYSDDGYTNTIEQALMLINAEIQVGRAAFPEHPLYLLKIDLQDYYASLPHDLLLALLERLGMNTSDRELIRRFLQIPIQDNNQVIRVQRGVPIHFRLADLLAELVLRLLDQQIQQAARVQIVRMVDDICLLATSAEDAIKAWHAVQDFCATTGLKVHAAKCGSVCIGGERPAALPDRLPTWLMVTLDEQGHWGIDQTAVAAYQEQSRQWVQQEPSIIGQVRRYNAQLTYLSQAIAIGAMLDSAHRQAVNEVLTRFHHAFFHEQQGIIDHLRQAIREQVSTSDAAHTLPEAWISWPITAGGLGLSHAPLLATLYAEAFAQRTLPVLPTERPSDWQRQSNEWSAYYASLLSRHEPAYPEPQPVMETLVEDFIRRGGDISAGQQRGLSTYWRWVLYLYGPHILEAFGSFRFLLTELVPVHLILQRLGVGSDDDIVEDSEGDMEIPC